MPTTFDVEGPDHRRRGAAPSGGASPVMMIAGGVGVLVVVGIIAGVVMSQSAAAVVETTPPPKPTPAPFDPTTCKIDQCTEVVVPNSGADGNCDGKTCKVCGAAYQVSSDASYCELTCEMEGCTQLVVPRSATTCAEKKCTACSPTAEGLPRIPLKDDQGTFCGLECKANIENCAKAEFTAIGRDATDCNAAKTAQCVECDGPNGVAPKGYMLSVDDKFKFTGKCSAMCTDAQILAGCNPNGCMENNKCTCLPGFNPSTTGGSLACVKASAPASMRFYMYRASRGENYHQENVDLASAGGLMWFLHDQVVRLSCADASPSMTHRYHEITRILRYDVHMKNPQAVFDYVQGHSGRQFGHYEGFAKGQCKNVTRCMSDYASFGYAVGCQGVAINPATIKTDERAEPWYGSRFSHSYTYSLPGRCPAFTFDDPKKKNASYCAMNMSQPGGECPKPNGFTPRFETPDGFPDGSPACTWHAAEAGELALDDLSGLSAKIDPSTKEPFTYADFCAAGGREYNPDTDKGTDMDFWNDKASPAANAERTRIMLKMFAAKYPTIDASHPDPFCDSW